MNKIETWNLARQVMQRIMGHYWDAMEKAGKSTGLEPSGCFLVIIPAYLFDPDPISAARLRKKIPYNSPAYYEEPLLLVKNAGFIDEAQEGGYILNQRGHEAFRKIMGTVYVQMERFSPLQLVKMEALKLLLAKLVQASILSPGKPGKWSILHSRRLDPGRNAAPTIAIDQYLSDLAAFRDDAHLASWSSRSISAHAWDILGLLWQDMAESTAEVVELVKKRRWTENKTLEAVNELVRKGWITDKGKLTITEGGRIIREDSETLTNEFFFLPWDVLPEIEYKKLGELLTAMYENLAG